MALPSLFQRRKSAAAGPAGPTDTPEVMHARTLARRRLIGAAVLLAVGVVSFPLLFEGKPRPVPVDLPIEVAARQEPVVVAPAVKPVTPAASPAPAGPAAVQPSKTADSSEEVPAPAEPVAPAGQAVASAPMPAPPATMPTTPAAAAPPREAAAAAAPAAPSTVAPEAKAQRFVVQIGAFADAGAAREARLRADKLGLKTYTQLVDTESGKRTRVRVGPFATRDEAVRAQARLKEAGLAGNLLVL